MQELLYLKAVASLNIDDLIAAHHTVSELLDVSFGFRAHSLARSSLFFESINHGCDFLREKKPTHAACMKPYYEY